MRRLALAALLALAAAAPARADVIVMLQRTNLRAAPTARAAVAGAAERYEVLPLLRTAVDARGGLWYQVDRDVNPGYWRFVKFGRTGWALRDAGFPADVFAAPADGRERIEILEHKVAKQRVKFTGREQGAWAQVSYADLEDYLKNKAWVFHASACRRARWDAEDARAFLAELQGSALPDEAKNWFLMGRRIETLREIEPRAMEAPPEERAARARELLLTDRAVRLGMPPEQVRLAWGDPAEELRVEAAESGEAGFEWQYPGLSLRFDDGLVSEIYPGNR